MATVATSNIGPTANTRRPFDITAHAPSTTDSLSHRVLVRLVAPWNGATGPSNRALEWRDRDVDHPAHPPQSSNLRKAQALRKEKLSHRRRPEEGVSAAMFEDEETVLHSP
ncbi:hypothetical protein DFI02_104100 [Rhizobium sp. PP-F2F-G20b]|nr:hypothetical protein C8J32_106215 [Rhizobium sp. PP-CC-3A-592]PYE43396.1 hypothetical protein DFI02_104100 [Rhizobium sp. PP-F2F-G20b]